MHDLTLSRVAFFGGIYSNYLALSEALRMAKAANVEAVWALGDFGAFGPHPDRTCEILREHGVSAIQGNYEEALSSASEDCHCGYTDPRDNHFAQISYDYTFERTSREHKEWMGTLPLSARLTLGEHRLLLAHGSPRKINEFLWRSTTPVPFVEKMLDDQQADVVVCTHTGIHWSRLHAQNRGVVNVGALGRPANDGKTNVWFAILDATRGDLEIEFLPVHYDHARLAEEMRAEGLPQAFVTTILEGWWTTCLEILPAKERATGRY